MVGMETALAVVVEAMKDYDFDFGDVARVISQAPARITGATGHGDLETGASANIVLIDPAAPHTITPGRACDEGPEQPLRRGRGEHEGHRHLLLRPPRARRRCAEHTPPGRSIMDRSVSVLIIAGIFLLILLALTWGWTRRKRSQEALTAPAKPHLGITPDRRSRRGLVRLDHARGTPARAGRHPRARHPHQR